MIRTAFFSTATLRRFQLPPSFKPNTRVVDDLPFLTCLKIWAKSWNPDRLQQVQSELVELMIPSNKNNFTRIEKQTKIDKNNHINQLTLQVKNGSNLPPKNIVFLHGYGASLGYFARNFQIINKLQGLKHDYDVHFLDNITFGLSSNPKMTQTTDFLKQWKIEKAPAIKLNDNTPTEAKKLHNKYYKLIDSYEINVDEFRQYQANFKPVLQDIENFYLQALENWRISSNINKIDYLVGHSYGGHWSASYAIRHKENVSNLVLLSPVGVERHVHALDNDLQGGHYDETTKLTTFKPSLDPASYNFLSRWPLLSQDHIKTWYHYQPFLPRMLTFMGPYGVLKYYKMWYYKLFKINKLIHKLGGPSRAFSSENDLVYGTNRECLLIIEYLYNSITSGTHSDIYIKYMLTPSTVSKWPLYDKFDGQDLGDVKVHVMYGQYDFMNSEAGMKMVKRINEHNEDAAKFYKVSEGGHNLYIDNPFEVNERVAEIVRDGEKEKIE